MRSKVLFMAMFGLAIFMTSCSQKLVPFTQEIRDTYDLSEEDLQSIQFYISKGFIMKRGERTGEKETDGGELTLKKEHFVEEVVVNAKTPCVVKRSVDGHTLMVEFEEGSDKFLVFGSKRNSDGFYTLRALEWKNGRGKINYGDKYYFSTPGSRDVFLALKLRSIENFRSEQKVLKGKKL